MKVTIAEPVLTNPLEQFKPTVAESTRKLLVEMFPADDTADGDVLPMDKATLKEIKQLVYAGCNRKMATWYDEHPSPEAHVLRALGVAAYVANLKDNREGSYRVEFAFQWLHGYLFRNQLPMPTAFPARTLGVLSYPTCTSALMDVYLTKLQIQDTQLLGGLHMAVPAALLNLCTPEITTHREECSYKDQKIEVEVAGVGDYCGVVYTEKGTAWFAGFLTIDDVLKLRFRRMRLGAAVKELTGDDSLARKAADIRDVNNFELVLHPNDRPFGAEYVRMYQHGVDLSSCMTRYADGYQAPFDVHPCDVYSCAHYGQGDNGLVLVEALQDGSSVGRGILNVHTKQIVRWYGEYKAEVMLRNKFDIHVCDGALEDAQLALIQDKFKIAAPYLDGGQVCAIVSDKLFIRNQGDIVMDSSDGYQYTCACEIDVCSGDCYPEGELIYQPIHETYYHPDNTNLGVVCYITSEYCAPDGVLRNSVDGEYTLISEAIYYGEVPPPHGWEYLGDGVGWTMHPEDYEFDEVTELWYTNEAYKQLVAEREEEEGEDKDEAA